MCVCVCVFFFSWGWRRCGSEPLVSWSSGPVVLVLWSPGPLVLGCGSWKATSTVNYGLRCFRKQGRVQGTNTISVVFAMRRVPSTEALKHNANQPQQRSYPF